MNWLGRIKMLLAKVTLVMEFCHECGRAVPVVWTSPDGLWDFVTEGEPTILCPNCFDRRAKRKGLFIRWVPHLERMVILATPVDDDAPAGAGEVRRTVPEDAVAEGQAPKEDSPAEGDE